MKRIMIVWLALGLALTPLTAWAAAYDFSGLTLEELYEVRSQLNQKIEEAEREAEIPIYESGVYIVGNDIPSGEYLLTEDRDAIFPSVIVRTDADEDAELLLYSLINGQSALLLATDTCVTITEASAIPLSAAEMYGGEGEIGAGGYLIGAMLPAGMYEVTVDGRAPLSSYSVYSGILGTGAQLLRFERLQENTVLELNDGEYVELIGCSLLPEGA